MTHILDAGTIGSQPDYAGIALRKPKLNNGGIGGGGKKNRVKLKTKVNLKLVSPKQAARTYQLNKKLKRMMVEQELHGENPHCMICGAIRNENKNTKLVADHINTRNEWDADRFEKLGILCWACNTKKSSRREDYRPEWFRQRMLELDKL
jgi:5-methylcytosine-specific restriction endonuclease McrA